MAAILKVKDEKTGNWIEFPAIQGAKGDKGDKGDTGAKGDKGDTPSLEGYATEQYVDDAIAAIDLPSGGGGGEWRVLAEQTTEEEVHSIVVEFEEVKEVAIILNAMFTESGKYLFIHADGKNVYETTSIYNNNKNIHFCYLNYTGEVVYGLSGTSAGSTMANGRLYGAQGQARCGFINATGVKKIDITPTTNVNIKAGAILRIIGR